MNAMQIHSGYAGGFGAYAESVACPKLAGRCSHYRAITRERGLCEIMFEAERKRAVEDGQARKLATLDWDDVCVGCDEWERR